MASDFVSPKFHFVIILCTEIKVIDEPLTHLKGSKLFSCKKISVDKTLSKKNLTKNTEA